MHAVTADSNIYVSALQFGGVPLQFLNAARAGAFELVVSDALVEEILGVLREKFSWDTERLAGFVAEIGEFVRRVRPTEKLCVIASDPDDDRVLECAIAGRCHFIVTGDKHLLEVRSYESIRILKVADFLEILKPTR